MAMLPIFICGLILGSMLTFAYMKYKKDTPSQVKIEILENTIEGLKDDIALLEITNSELRQQLKEKQNNK